jgi:hypothetical protein
MAGLPRRWWSSLLTSSLAAWCGLLSLRGKGGHHHTGEEKTR